MLIVAIIVSGCANKGFIKPDPCAGWSPIYISKADVLTDGTAKAVLAHDLHGVQAGCWKAPVKK